MLFDRGHRFSKAGAAVIAVDHLKKMLGSRCVIRADIFLATDQVAHIIHQVTGRIRIYLIFRAGKLFDGFASGKQLFMDLSANLVSRPNNFFGYFLLCH